MTLASLDLVALAAQHTRHLRTLIGEPLTTTRHPDASKAVMLAAFQAAEIEILQTMALVDPADYDRRPVCGHWTLHDLVGHLADWDSYFIDWLNVLLGGPPSERYWDNDGDRFNAWLNEQRRGETWEQTWADFRGNRQTLTQRLAEVPERAFLRKAKQTAPFPSVYHCAWSALEHYIDHATGLRRELQLPLPEVLLHFHGPYTD